MDLNYNKMAKHNNEINYVVIYGKFIYQRAKSYAIKKLMAKGIEQFKNKHITKINEGDLTNLYKYHFDGNYFLEYVEIAKSQMLKNELKKIEPKVKHIVDPKSKVYFIVNDVQGICKIGTSVNPNGRLHSIQTGCPYPLRIACTIDGDIKLERQLHDKFMLYRLSGEWFKYRGRVLQFIQDTIANNH